MASSSRTPMPSTLRTTLTDQLETCEIYILVMGLTGAGKSTFISIATEDDSIQMGEADDMDGVTQDVQDYIMYYRHQNTEYAIHLIDSPGFDDGTFNDAEVLSRIANYINTIYRLKHTIAGVLYLHDITKAKMGGVGVRNLRMLENMIGVDKWDNCTLVTTKWGCTDNPEGEAKREMKLRQDSKYFKEMCESSKHARMARFARTKGSALTIIKPHLDKKFLPAISVQMVDPKGPQMALGDTDAGRIVADNLDKLFQANNMIAETKAARELLEQKFNEKLFQEFKEKRDALQRKHSMQRGGRWLARTAILAGGIAATVVTLGPGATTLVLEPAFEKFLANPQRRREGMEKYNLEAEYVRQTKASETLSRHGAGWLRNKRVKELSQLDSDETSLSDSSSHTGLYDNHEGEESRDDLTSRPSSRSRSRSKSHQVQGQDTGKQED